MPTSKRKVSSEHIAHYTREYKTLCSILKSHHFQIHYCLETYYFIKKGLQVRVPMVCFTDLPNGINGKHKRRYGNYAIVFNKNWATEKRISPILYLRKDSIFTDTIREIFKIDNPGINQNLFAFCKPYCARYYNSKKEKWSAKNRRFYDEREWRYVPQNYTEYIDNHRYENENLDFKLAEIEQIYVTTTIERKELIDKYPILNGKILVK